MCSDGGVGRGSGGHIPGDGARGGGQAVGRRVGRDERAEIEQPEVEIRLFCRDLAGVERAASLFPS